MTLSDFIVAGVLLTIVAGLLIAAGKLFKQRRFRVLAWGAILAVGIWIWAELAVGIFTNWGS